MRVIYRLQIHGSSRTGRTMEDLLTQPGQDGKHSDTVQQAISLKVSDHTLMLDNPASARSIRPADANDHSQHLLSRKASKNLDLYSVAGQKGLRCARLCMLHPGNMIAMLFFHLTSMWASSAYYLALIPLWQRRPDCSPFQPCII